MEDVALNLFDLTVLIVVGLSALMAFYRGFIREVLSLGGWVVASFVTLRFLESATGFVKAHVANGSIASGIAAIGLFLITLILFSLASNMIVKILKPAAKIGLIDNLAGLTFGVARGVLIIALGYLMMSLVIVNEKEYPKVVKQALTKPYIEKVVHWMQDQIPNLNKLTGNKKSDSDDETPTHADEEKLMRKLDKAREDAVKKIKDAADDAEEKVDDTADKMPSIEDLQKRIREENEKNDVR